MILSIVLWLRMSFNVSHFGSDAQDSAPQLESGEGARDIPTAPGLTSSCRHLLRL